MEKQNNLEQQTTKMRNRKESEGRARRHQPVETIVYQYNNNKQQQ